MAQDVLKPFWTRQASSNPASCPIKGPISDVLRHVPEPVSLQLSEHQIAVLNEAMTRRRHAKNHTIDYRAKIRWFRKHYYFALVAGQDVRERLDGKRVFSPRRLIIKVGQFAALYLLVAAIAIPVLLVLYLMKSIAGIDLFEGSSFLHDFIFN